MNSRWSILIIIFLPIVVWTINGFYLENILDDPILFFIQDGFSYVLLPLGCIFVLYHKYEFSTIDFGIKTSSKLNRFNPSMEVEYVGIVLFLFIFWLIFYKFGVANNKFSGFGYKSFLSQYNYFAKFMIILYFAATAALFEEIFYKSMIFKVVELFMGKSLFSSVFYFIVSCCLFSLSHFEGGKYMLLMSFAYAAISTLFYMKYRDIRPLIISHFIIDMYSFS